SRLRSAVPPIQQFPAGGDSGCGRGFLVSHYPSKGLQSCSGVLAGQDLHLPQLLGPATGVSAMPRFKCASIGPVSHTCYLLISESPTGPRWSTGGGVSGGRQALSRLRTRITCAGPLSTCKVRRHISECNSRGNHRFHVGHSTFRSSSCDNNN